MPMSGATIWYTHGQCVLMPPQEALIVQRGPEHVAAGHAGAGSPDWVWEDRSHGAGSVGPAVQQHQCARGICPQVWLPQDCLPGAQPSPCAGGPTDMQFLSASLTARA